MIENPLNTPDSAGQPAFEAANDFWSWIVWRAECSPDRPLAFDEHGRRLDFGAFHVLSERVAAGLVEAGVRPGTRVAWILPTQLESLVLSGALARLGCEQVPLMPVLGQRELAFVLAQARPERVVVGRGRGGVEHADFIRAALAEQAEGRRMGEAVSPGRRDRVIDIGDGLPEADPAQLGKFVSGDGDPLRWIFYTSGTTSDPKGVLHTDATLLAAAIGLEAPHKLKADDRLSLVFPYAHVGGPSLVLSALRVGHGLILVEKFDVPVVIETLSRCGVTLAGSGPAFWQAFIAAQRAAGDRTLFPSLRALIGGGAAKPLQLHAEAREVLGVSILSGYGSTECPGLAYNYLGDPEEVLLSDGRAVDGVELRIVRGAGIGADAGTPQRGVLGISAGVGEEGEIRVRGPMLCKGYLGEEALPLDGAGFFCTGDLGRIDAAGQLVVTGRMKDIIIRKGENISAKEIEDLLGTHAAISEVSVVGLPDLERGERCCAIVVPRLEAEPPTLVEITDHCHAAGLMKVKIPEQIEIVDALPRNSTGKVLKAELRRRFSERK